MTMMMIRTFAFKTVIFSIIFISSCCLLFAKKPSYPKEDRKIWGSVELKYSVTNDFDLEVSEELRYYKERKILEQTLTDFGVSYRFTNWLKSGISYRYKTYNDEDIDKDQYANEINTYVTISTNLYGFDISNKLRLQSRFKEIEDDAYFVRNKLNLEYKNIANWIKPFTSAELFQRIAAGTDNEITKARYALGLTFIPIKNHEFSVYFLRENEHNKKKIINSNVIGFGYQLKL